MKLAGANAIDHAQLLPLLRKEFPTDEGPPGRPKQNSDQLQVDAGYDSEAVRKLLRSFRVEPFMRRRGTPHGSGPGELQGAVERTIGQAKHLRRLRVLYNRTKELIEAWIPLATAVINYRL